MELNLAQSVLELRGDTPHPIEVRVSGRRVLTLGTELAEAPDDGVIRYRLPPAFALSLRGSGDLVVHSAHTGAELARTHVRSITDPDGRLRFTDATGQAVVLNKWGHHAVTFAEAEADSITDLLRHTTEVFDALTRFGLRPWLMGGTLLGPVRSGALLPHDDDSDVGYVSAHENPADVALESFALQRFLEAEGHIVTRYSATQMQILFPDARGTSFHVDVFGGFYRDEMFMQPFHVRAPIPRDTFEQLSEVEIEGWSFAAPNPPERWLEANYGATWRIPDAGHRFVTPPSAARRYVNWFGNTNLNVHFWNEENEFHADSDDRADAPSHTATAFLDRVPADATVYDLGCGTGADLAHLSSRGHRVIGVDFSASALAASAARLGPRRSAVSLRQLDVGDRRQTLALAIEESRVPGAAHILAANLMHVIPRESRPALLDLIRFLLRRGGEWVASFATVPAPGLSVEDPTTWHLTVPQFQELIDQEPTLETQWVEVDTGTDRRVATVGVGRKGTSQ